MNIAFWHLRFFENGDFFQGNVIKSTERQNSWLIVEAFVLIVVQPFY